MGAEYPYTNTYIPNQGLWRKCGTCGFVGVSDVPEVLDWVMRDHAWRYHGV